MIKYLLPALLTLLVSCHRPPPSGQVVVRVNGEDITQRDLDIEREADSRDTTALPRALLDRVIFRKLAAREARNEALNLRPDFLGTERRDRELLLEAQLAKRLAASLPAPSDAEVAAFIADNPVNFGDRHVFIVDRLSVVVPSTSDTPLPAEPSASSLAGWLAARGTPYDRSYISIDPLVADPAIVAAVKELAPGDSKTTRAGSGLTIYTMIAAQSAPIPTSEQKPIARATMRRLAGAEAVSKALARLRTRSHIEYRTDNFDKSGD